MMKRLVILLLAVLAAAVVRLEWDARKTKLELRFLRDRLTSHIETDMHRQEQIRDLTKRLDLLKRAGTVTFYDEAQKIVRIGSWQSFGGVAWSDTQWSTYGVDEIVRNQPMKLSTGPRPYKGVSVYDTTLSVEHPVLRGTIKELQEAMGDSAQRPFYDPSGAN